MKRQLTLSLAVILCCAPFAPGQSPSPSAAQPGITAPSAAPTPAGQGAGPAGPLTPDDRQRFLAAREKARKDPNVLAASAKLRDAQKALGAAMLAKDPSLAPIFAKVNAAATPGAPQPQLTADELGHFHSVRAELNGSPASNNYLSAVNDFQTTIRNALIAADPSIQSILDKMPHPPTAGSPGSSK